MGIRRVPELAPGGVFTMSMSAFVTLLLMVAGAVLLGLIVAGIVYAGSSRRARRYRPGRPFPFTPVWFLASPERQILAGTGGRELMAASAESMRAGRGETGGASDRW